ncbi:MAG: response regulator, partial [Thermodesulfobacteriota bacterium]
MKPVILIVDDDERNVILLSVKMEREGYIVESASNGVDALERVNTINPDVILMDVMMPKMNGYEVLKVLKADEKTRYIPVIMLTGLGQVENKVQGFDVGAEDYITKPFSLREVSARVRALLRMRALQKRIQETDKMAALGGMADGIAHEIRNPLMVIGGLARRLSEGNGDEEKNKKFA